jgi:glutamyl-Q tRNA(Asp) synthetase
MSAQLHPKFRFAPSPNGKLHLGHAYCALFTQFWAHKMGAEFILRIEDVDITRSRPEFINAIYEDLEWLGITWAAPVLQQSQRFDIYENHAQRLKDLGLLYPCYCSRREIADNAKQVDPDGAPLYPGTCKHLSEAQREVLGKSTPAKNWRLDTEAALNLTGPLTYSIAQPHPNDRPQIRYARPQIWGDIVVQRLGTPTSYHLGVVVDDALQEISHVTRGRDLEAATHIHILLQFLLGFTSPLYTHHKLIMDAAGHKMSKSMQSTSLQSLREAGQTPRDIRTRLGF